nr:golgin subfamily A member 4-like [Penaeus vannamei]
MKMNESFLESKELEDLRKEFQTWQTDVSGAILLERQAREEVALLTKELERSKTQLQEAEKCIAVYNKKLQDLVQNYAALSPVIEKKNHLVKEVTSLREKLQEVEKKHSEEVDTLKVQQQEAAKEGQETVEATRAEPRKHKCLYFVHLLPSPWPKKTRQSSSRFCFHGAFPTAKELAEKHQAALKELEDLLQKEKVDKKAEAEHHSKVIEEMRRKHHQEMESLRGRLQLLQQSMSSRATSNMDLFANKLQATRAEFEDQISARDSRITKLEESSPRQGVPAPPAAPDCMRGVVTNSASTPTSSPGNRPESRPGEAVSPKEGDGDLNAEGASDPGTSASSSTTPTVRESDETPRGPAASVAGVSRMDKKRKLYSGESLLQDPSV